MRQGRGDRDRFAAMRALGKSWADIARIIRMEQRVSARAAMRMAHGWTQAEAAERWTQRWPDDPSSEKRFRMWEAWPVSSYGNPPSLPRLTRLAQLYECRLDDLLADVDYATLSATGTDEPSPDPARLNDVERREFLLGGASLVAAPSMAAGALLDAIDGSRTTMSVGRPEIDQILEATAFLQRSDHAHGGGYARSLAVVQLRHAADLLQARCPTSLRADLFSAVAHLADNCGFMTFDAGGDERSDRAARGMWNAALACTEEASDWHLQVAVLVNMSRQALWLAEPNGALALSERALALSHQVTPRERALVWSTRASVHAQRGDVPATVAAIKAADGHFAKALNTTAEPSWMYYYDDAEHASSTGHALYDLVMTTGSEYDEAVIRQRRAVDGFPRSEARSKTLSGTRLAILQMRGGDPDEAATTGGDLLDVASQIRSRRTRRYFDVLSQVAEPHSGRPVVADLQQRLAQPA